MMLLASRWRLAPVARERDASDDAEHAIEPSMKGTHE
jgi:hypothetical protein